LSVEDLWQVGDVAVDRVLPAQIFVLDMDVADAVKRMNREPDRIESQGPAYMESVRRGFLAEAERRSEIVIIDAARDVQSIQTDVRAAAEAVLEAFKTVDCMT
jgi:dTMP kinase